MRSETAARVRIIAGMVGLVIVQMALGAAAWGSFRAFVGHPARAATIALMVVLGIVASFSGVNFDRGRREDPQNAFVAPVLVVGTLLFGWLLPYLDCRGIWVVDGDVVRYLGLAILVPASALRVWPMFVLGHRFSAFVAIQEGHELMTEGPYRYVRHPSYLGALLGAVGWALVFRSVVGLLLSVLVWGATLVRIDAEERLLASEFGAAYEVYRSRTWRLIPGLD